MTLREKQSLFVRLIVDLIVFADANGWQVTFGEAWRSPEEAARLAKLGKGIKNSLHTSRLAIDLNLFKDGKYQTASESYRRLGEYWMSLSHDDIECAWGGTFKRVDGNHFSIAHQGRK